MQTENAALPLTQLSEEELMFRDAVAGFAEEEVRPRVMAMEAAAQIDPVLIPKYFELGLMGIEVPEEYGGAGGTLFMVTLAVEEISKIDASSRGIAPVSRWARRSTSLESAPRAQPSSFSTIARCPKRTCWARLVRDT